MNIYVTMILSLTVLNACSASELGLAEPEGRVLSPVVGTKSANADLASSCRRLLTRQRKCSEQLLPALMAERVRRDLPAGIAARDEAMGREALLAEAVKEYAVDSTDDAIAATCEQVQSGVAPEQRKPIQVQVDDCASLESCEQLVKCAVPLSVR